MSQAYQQILLDDRSVELTTISTHKGLFQYTRLPFGITSAPAHFQKVMETVLQGSEDCVSFYDDILIGGKNVEKHVENLRKVLTKLSEAGFKIKREKCNFFVDEICYLGYKINKDGLHTTEEKIAAIRDAPVPKSITELKSFLGLVNYYAKFVPNISTILFPLYQLLKKKVNYVWSQHCKQAFEKIKVVLMSASVLVHFNSELPIVLTCDASNYGVGAVLSHIFPNGEEKPIAYASKKLNSAEVNYSQIEKQTLGIIFGISKFNHYLYGQKFILRTDHKPLVTIFNPSKGIPIYSANRLRRWAVILSNYNYEIQYVKSENNAADSLSRIPIRDDSEIIDECQVDYINFFESMELPIDYLCIKRETETDNVLKSLGKYIKFGWPREVTNKEVLKFYNFRNELTIYKEVILWNNKIVIPYRMRPRLLNELHMSHMGATKMKELARNYFWWPGLNSEIERKVHNCERCKLVMDNPPKHQLHLWEWPKEPWSRLHIDYFGPIYNKYFLIVLDAHSKWIEVFPTSNTTSSFTIQALTTLFARFGLPNLIVSDNGPQFKSGEFAKFLRNIGVRHITTAPFSPASNGAAENAVRTVKNALKRVLFNKKSNDVFLALHNFLFDYRNTPHLTTKQTPSWLMFKRNINFRFSRFHPKMHIRFRKSFNGNDNVIRAQRRQLINNSSRREMSFNIGQRVMVKDFRGSPNKPTWIKGQITQRLGKCVYLCKVAEFGKVWKRHANQIKMCKVFENTLASLPNSDTNVDAEIRVSPERKLAVQDRPKREIRPPDRLTYE